MIQQRILVVEDDADLREAVCDTLELEGIASTAASHGKEALVALEKESYVAVLSDVSMPEMGGHQLLAEIQRRQPGLPVILMTAYGSIDKAVEAMRAGAQDYLVKPFEPQTLLDTLSPLLGVGATSAEEGAPIAEDPVSVKLLQLAEKVARSEAAVMIGGASGTGKEVLARFIHTRSDRADNPFVAINCAAIPDTMLEATLFGYEKGAFTGASNAAPGKFEQAQGGTLLLDEVTEMPLALQAKLLRVLQEREVERLGGRKPIALNVRVLATSNRDLKQSVAEGIFREDLYYRLNVFPLNWPPLCQRPKDILPLAQSLLMKHAHRMGMRVPQLEEAVVERLLAYEWPGNVRELDNVMQRALILSSAGWVCSDDIVLETDRFCLSRETEHTVVPVTEVSDLSRDDAGSGLGDGLREQEYRMILEALRAEDGRKKETAERLGISPRTLRYKLAKMRSDGWLER
ncbi:sigma-54-dependent Fis family transcriptional regulator [Terasakiispira papahanaumokuakeensis]|uniref:Sigma-54-dependent Fis family transcriptional regulator n=1 Tax=Terasakiispira papahanaumokuakeensis TaxID=197479 RepID=A0A1E2VAZ2_9GAMM|nr:sigma-54 dependent transcriptional regulator [Terasakiispira papahanaumokuakeensis]ODC04157.1 sigma-54-dependent Fis family transcriptional regulator [Terasakiispira papahanaumokuakeensis]